MNTKKNLFVWTFLFVFVVLAFNQEKNYQPYYVVEDYVKPSMVFEYEAALKEYIQYHRDHNFERPVFVFKTDDNYYYYSIPMGYSFSELDSINKEYSALGKKDKERWEDIFSKFKDTYVYNKSFVITFSKKHSYIPEDSENSETENNFREFTYVYGKVGMREDFVESCYEWVKIFSENKLPLGFETYFGYTGTEEPFYMWISSAENPVDFWTKSKTNSTFFNEHEEYSELWKKTLKTIRKIEVRNAWYMPEYSYIPKKE